MLNALLSRIVVVAYLVGILGSFLFVVADTIYTESENKSIEIWKLKQQLSAIGSVRSVNVNYNIKGMPIQIPANSDGYLLRIYDSSIPLNLEKRFVQLPKNEIWPDSFDQNPVYLSPTVLVWEFINHGETSIAQMRIPITVEYREAIPVAYTRNQIYQNTEKREMIGTKPGKIISSATYDVLLPALLSRHTARVYIVNPGKYVANVIYPTTATGLIAGTDTKIKISLENSDDGFYRGEWPMHPTPWFSWGKVLNPNTVMIN